MADKFLDIIIRARNEAAGALGNLNRQLQDLADRNKELIGARSGLDDFLDLLTLSGAGFKAFGDTVQMLGQGADKVREIAAGFVLGKTNAAEMGRELARSIPVFGMGFSLGEKLANAFHDSRAAIALATGASREWALSLASVETQLAAVEASLKRQAQISAMQLETAKRAAAARDSLNTANTELQRKAALAEASEHERDRLKALHEFNDAERRILAERKKAADTEKNPVLMEQAFVTAAQALAAAARIRDAALAEADRKEDERRQKIFDASRKAIEEEREAERKKTEEMRKAAGEREALEQETQAKRLAAAGKTLEAEIAQMKAGYTKKLATATEGEAALLREQMKLDEEILRKKAEKKKQREDSGEARGFELLEVNNRNRGLAAAQRSGFEIAVDKFGDKIERAFADLARAMKAMAEKRAERENAGIPLRIG